MSGNPLVNLLRMSGLNDLDIIMSMMGGSMPSALYSSGFLPTHDVQSTPDIRRVNPFTLHPFHNQSIERTEDMGELATECVVCCNIYHNPVRLGCCNQVVCDWCFHKTMTAENNPRRECSLCRQSPTFVTYDRELASKLGSACMAKCTNDCGWKAPAGSTIHICEKDPMQCLSCNQSVPVDLVDDHRTKQCPTLWYICEKCNQKVLGSEAGRHRDMHIITDNAHIITQGWTPRRNPLEDLRARLEDPHARRSRPNVDEVLLRQLAIVRDPVGAERFVDDDIDDGPPAAADTPPDPANDTRFG